MHLRQVIEQLPVLALGCAEEVIAVLQQQERLALGLLRRIERDLLAAPRRA